jgi:hypothetical protein
MQLQRSTEAFLGLWLSDPDSVGGRFPAAWRVLSELNQAALPGRPPFNISTTLLPTTREELAGLVGSFYRGRIDGLDDPIDTTPERPTRLRRFGAWALEWAFAIAVAAAVIALVAWLS